VFSLQQILNSKKDEKKVSGSPNYFKLGFCAFTNFLSKSLEAVRGLINLVIVSLFQVGISIFGALHEIVKYFLDIK
jgi:hypothetical protein